MRIISGKYKGKVIKGFNIEGTRPTMDRVKESVFASIQNKLRDSIFLDLYSGSGNIGIEALSNYSKYVYMVDNNSISINTIKDNLKSIKENNYAIIKSDASNYLKELINKGIKLDIIY